MEILTPTLELPNLLAYAAPAAEFESPNAKPQDDASTVAEALGRVNASYDPVWKAVREAAGKWVPIRCVTVRRAMLIASAALQHRTQHHEVWRRGRLVCIKLKVTT